MHTVYGGMINNYNTTLTYFSTKYLAMYKVYNGVDYINKFCHGCLPVHYLIHEHYIHAREDKP